MWFLYCHWTTISALLLFIRARSFSLSFTSIISSFTLLCLLPSSGRGCTFLEVGIRTSLPSCSLARLLYSRLFLFHSIFERSCSTLFGLNLPHLRFSLMLRFCMLSFGFYLQLAKTAEKIRLSLCFCMHFATVPQLILFLLMHFSFQSSFRLLDVADFFQSNSFT